MFGRHNDTPAMERIAQLEREVAKLRAHVDWNELRRQAEAAAALFRKPVEVTAPVYIGAPAEVIPLFWLSKAVPRYGSFPNRDSAGYTLSTEDALRFTELCQGNRAQLIKAWKLPDGRIALKDPATAGVPVVAELWRPRS